MGAILGSQTFSTRRLRVTSFVSLFEFKCSAPKFEVMMMKVFLKSTVRPKPSVRIPSSRTWSNTSNTEISAFSTSSKRMTLYGCLRIFSVSCPPRSWPIKLQDIIIKESIKIKKVTAYDNVMFERIIIFKTLEVHQ
jgi:hypothetical protein